MLEKNTPSDNSENNKADITPEEQAILDASQSSGLSQDDRNLRSAKLDNTDEDGEKLNTIVGLSGEDLDVPGAELDDEEEILGSEDEENNNYSQADTE